MPPCIFAAQRYHTGQHELGLREGEGRKLARGEVKYHVCLPSGELTFCHEKLPFIVDFPIKNGDFPLLC